MSDWNAAQYLKFKNQRTQPAKDLAMRIENDPKTIVDLGCGPGNSTKVLRDAFPHAALLGIDSSENMVQKAKAEHPEIEFRLCDVHALTGQYDLLFSNACLQWVPEHEALIPSLMERLNPGGVLAVQIPMNQDEPFFRLIREVADEPEWGLEHVALEPNKTLTPGEYYNILTRCASSFDVWEVQYCHQMPDHQALLDWAKGTRLRPYLDALDARRGAAFEAELVRRAVPLYPKMADGSIVFHFRRFFFTAVK